MNVPCSIWLLDSPEMVLDYSLRGGKVIFITEDIDERLKYIPNKLSAKILLPPFESTEAELDGNTNLSQNIYYRYLSSGEAAEYITVITAAIVQGIGIGLFFGPELKDMIWPMMFINYLYNAYGIVVGYRNVTPSIIPKALPIILTNLYGNGFIDVDKFLISIPVDADIAPGIIPKIVYDLQICPTFVKNGDYVGYIKNLIKEINEAGKILHCPIKALPEGRYT